MYALYEQGATMREVSEKFGCSVSVISPRFRTAGLATREKVGRGSQTRPRRRWEHGYPIDEMYAAYQEGLSLTQVGERFGVSKAQLSKRFKAAGLATRPRRSPDADRRIAAMYERYQAGAALREVAEEFGVSYARVRNLFLKAGLPTYGQAKKARR